MKVTLESTSQIVELVTASGTVPARLWEGETEGGVRCYAAITRIAVSKHDDAAEFELDLKEQKPPSAAGLAAIPLRMVL